MRMMNTAGVCLGKGLCLSAVCPWTNTYSEMPHFVQP